MKKSYQDLHKKIEEKEQEINENEEEINRKTKALVASSHNIDLYLEKEDKEKGHYQFAIYLHEKATKIGHVRVDKELIMPFANIGYEIKKEHQGHHYALQSLELLRETMLKMKIFFQ